MTIITWLAGPNGQIFCSAAVMTILVLMLFMAVRLYASYKNKKIYRLLILSIPLFLLQHAALVYAPYAGGQVRPWMNQAATLLQIVSFIIINFVFLKLYAQRSVRPRGLPFVFMTVTAFVIAAVQVVFVVSNGLTEKAADDLHFLALDFYGLIATFMILLDTRGAELNIKYSASLIVYFVFGLARLAAEYVFRDTVEWLLVLTNLLPVVYFGLLFLLLFEWVIERLLVTYQSSITDGLTGLYNRRYFQLKAEQLLRKPKGMAIIFCDIDNFKKLNDTQGHHKADGVLKQVAEIIKEEASGIGSAGRYGGEELLACISLDKVKAQEVAETIRKRVESETIVTVSVGVGTSKDGASVQDIVKLADQAMYHSKTTGKNKVTLYGKMPKQRSASVPV
ncbi:GGDEF domain-containing protein [Paenibacillus thailandensis]|uniref:GGDEF domain-containing protein n=1 Tax=Paenibacillus thailandensis TaxID=393250 RepID=A0ABW5R2V8_9BACL